MPDLGSLWHAAWPALVAIGVLSIATWIISVFDHNVAIVDRVWSWFFIVAAIAIAMALPVAGPRTPWVIGLLAAWGVRLSVHITWRGWGHPEDKRYQAIRARNQPNFAFKSLYLVFVLQALIAWLASASLLAAIASRQGLGLLDGVAAVLCVFGIVFEAVADAQLSTFQRDAAHRGLVMDRGLWRWSRHPNYFGECCTWWGFYLFALSAGGWWAIVSPVIVTLLLLKVSGVALLEKDIGERRPKYKDYVRRTNAFIPGPRKEAA